VTQDSKSEQGLYRAARPVACHFEGFNSSVSVEEKRQRNFWF